MLCMLIDLVSVLVQFFGLGISRDEKIGFVADAKQSMMSECPLNSELSICTRISSHCRRQQGRAASEPWLNPGRSGFSTLRPKNAFLYINAFATMS